MIVSMKSAKYDIFISYSRKDIEVVDSFCSIFDAAGISYWIDREGIGADSFKSVIVDAIENSTIVVFFSSRNSNQSKWTAREIGVAVDSDKTIIPIRIDDSPYNKEVKFDLVNLNYYDLYNGNSDVLSSILKSIDEKLPHNVDWQSKECQLKMEELGLLFPVEKPTNNIKVWVIILAALLAGFILLYIIAFKGTRSNDNDKSAQIAMMERFDSCRNVLNQSLLESDYDAIKADISILINELSRNRDVYTDQNKIVVYSYLDSVHNVLYKRYDDMITSGRSRTADYYREQSIRVDSIIKTFNY